MSSRLFGDENAANDPLLHACWINRHVPKKPILVGRWGTGKTAILMHYNKELTKVLYDEDKDLRKSQIWYLGESNTFDVLQLTELAYQHADRPALLVRMMEQVWKGEIIRAAIVVLHKLWKYYGSPRGKHWDFVAQVAKVEGMARPIWQRLPEVVSLLPGLESRSTTISKLQHSAKLIFQDTALDHIQMCLKDFESDPAKVAIAIEPVDTPVSQMEEERGGTSMEGSLAQPVITALLNVYQNTFQLGPTQLLRVRLSIPWHRYAEAKPDLPQRFFEDVSSVRWDETGLADFINRRIQHELDVRVGRHINKTSDAWTSLFDGKVRNEHCKPEIFEDSLKYVLRHTHHRPRELQRLARHAVEWFAEEKGIGIEEVLRGKSGIKVSGTAIREAVRDITRPMFKRESLVEAGRRFTCLPRLVEALRGITVPFRTKELSKKLEGTGIGFSQALNFLWASGILGVQLQPRSADTVDTLRSALGLGGFRQYESDGHKIYRWSFFEYNYDGQPVELLERWGSPDEAEAVLVLHPKSFEYLLPHVARDCPVGA